MNVENPLTFDHVDELPAMIHFGTSTWTYEGWKGLVYRREYKSEREFKAETLREYAECPLFRCVGIDATFYNPPAPSLLQRYASQVPPSFVWLSKVWQRLTIPRYPSHARYGKLAGTLNPEFLNAAVFKEKVLANYMDPKVRGHTGPFIFQFGTISPSALEMQDFLGELQAFLSELPHEFRYAVEVRNPEYLCESYFSILNQNGATHCFNHWNYMPPLREQMKAAARAGGLTAPFFVSRILTPRGVDYAQAVARFKPYRTIQQPNAEMRRDVVRLAHRALERGCAAYILVNNRAEGNAPMTINAIGRMIVDQRKVDSELT